MLIEKKRCNISLSASRGFQFLVVLNASSLETSLLGNCLKIYPEGENRFCLSADRNGRAPLVTSQGPLAMCNPNEKQKPPPLPIRSYLRAMVEPRGVSKRY